MTNIAVPTSYDLSFELEPSHFSPSDALAPQTFNGSAKLAVLTATSTACFLLHAAGIRFRGIEIAAGLGPGGREVHDCACGPLSQCKLRDCSKMVIPVQQCAPPSVLCVLQWSGVLWGLLG